MKFTTNNVVVVINFGNEILFIINKKKCVLKILFKFLDNNNWQILTPLFGEFFPLKLGFWGVEKNLLYSLLCVTDHITFFFWKALPSHEEVICVTGLVTPRRQSLTFVEVQLQFVKAKVVLQSTTQRSYVVSCGLDHNGHSHVTTGRQSCVYEATASNSRLWS